jgi:hypothetical protein
MLSGAKPFMLIVVMLIICKFGRAKVGAKHELLVNKLALYFKICKSVSSSTTKCDQKL